MQSVQGNLTGLSVEEKRAMLAQLLQRKAEATTSEAPLSHGQQALWFLHRLAPTSAAYNALFAARVHSAIDLAALERACAALVQRHATLRTTYHMQNGQCVQRVHPQMELSFRQIDCPGLSEQELHTTIITAVKQPFDLEQGPLMRMEIYTRAPQAHVLVLTIHHVAIDYWSLAVMLDELRQLYAAYAGGTTPALPPLKLQYTDFVQWQAKMLASDEGEQHWAYWKEQLSGELPILDLPTDRPRPAVLRYHGTAYVFQMDSALSQQVRAFAKTKGSTLFATLLATFQVLLHRYTGQTDILVGTPTSGRSKATFEPLVGYFVNPVALRAKLAAHQPFSTVLDQARHTLLEALEHQDYPFPLLVDRLNQQRDPSRSPIFQVSFELGKTARMEGQGLTAFMLGQASSRMDFGGLDFESYPLEQQTGQFDLTLTVADLDEGFSVAFRYNPDLFDESTIARMGGHFETLLGSVVANAEQPIGALPLLTAAERQQILGDWSSTAPTYPHNGCPHHLFERQVAADPAAVALTFEDQHMSYGELNSRANQLAHHLIALGVGPEVPVGLCMERSFDLVVGILGILKAGGAYVPLDPSVPSERLAFILEDAAVPVLVTQEQMRDKVAATTAATVCVDTDWPIIAQQRDDNPQVAVGLDNLIYAIYTSGSTGKPKGVLLTHRNVLRLFEATHEWYQFNEHDVWALFHSFAFDMSVWEIWGAFLHGGRLVIVPHWVTRSPEAFRELLYREGVTSLNQTPSAFRQLMAAEVAADPAEKLALRCVTFGGEPLDIPGLKPWFDRYGDERPCMVNKYGITETTVHMTYRPVRIADTESISSAIGRPIPDQSIYLLDQRLQPVPVGVIGEIYAGGAGNARGYFNRPALTAERFVPHPFSAKPGDRLYKSGDLARFLPDGSMEYMGRIDHQVKIRGHRIELGEIETVLEQHPDVREAVVLAREVMPGDQRLVAYVVAREGVALTTSDLRSFMQTHLPEYMVPSLIMLLDEFPITANGKLDRRALPMPEGLRPDLQVPYVEPRSDLERTLAVIWKDVLRVERVGLDDNFFDLGGHSVLLVQVHSRLAETLGQDVPIISLFQHPTINSFTKYLGQSDTGPGAAQVGQSRAARRKQAQSSQKQPANDRRRKA